MRGLAERPPIKFGQKPDANDNIVEFAPSLAEADAILAATGYVDRELAAA